MTSLRMRLYDARAIRDARVTAAVREAGYRIPAVREVLASLDGSHGTRATDVLLSQRLGQLAERSVALLPAGANLASVIEA